MMPPWLCDLRYGKFSNSRSLPDADIQKLVAWADGGAPEGNPKDAPKPVDFPTSWSVGTPDLILKMPQEFEVPAAGELAYQNIVFPSGLTEDKWIAKMEIRPGNRAVVHHAIASAIAGTSAYAKRVPIGEFLDPKKFPDRIRPVNGREPNQFSSASDDAEALQVYLPGVTPGVTPSCWDQDRPSF